MIANMIIDSFGNTYCRSCGYRVKALNLRCKSCGASINTKKPKLYKRIPIKKPCEADTVKGRD